MKAPEKLYLRKRNKLPLEVVRDKWYETDPQSLYGSVEYTRTDAFEIKEVNLEKEISFQWSKFCLNGKDKDSFVKLAKHFFELGSELTPT